ncbi:MAG: pyridoxamine 5'-phosphate oxidase family protein [Candidatus Thorarchaeota archaeon]|nr:pyridoxamine 5'-phosphate oxidase family protein [Candidatus Thorarchaeota archaeon]
MTRDFKYIEKQIRKKTFGIIGTVDEKNRPHTTGVLYGVSHPSEPFAIYVATGAAYKKTRNIRQNHNVSFAIPFPHHALWFVPASMIFFQGIAEILPPNDEAARRAFSTKWILRGNIKMGEENEMNAVFIRVRPIEKIHVFGVGISMMRMMRNAEEGVYSVRVPKDRT